ncbi:MAG: efflux RND transporter permease subunit [Bdellovibrionales bacterium]|nr:efflux RND transporter permease subunit [Bdellovibrionales bacterium]
MKNSKFGPAGRLASLFVHSKLTPVLAVVSLLLGILSVWLTPKEEEPQISVPMIDIRTGAPGFEAAEVEKKVTEPIERAVWGLDGVEYVYSSSQAHGSLVTVRFKVGEPMEPSLVKVHHKLMSIRGELPPTASPFEVKSYSIDDVPFLVLTFSSAARDDYQLRSLVAPLAKELSSTPDLSRVEILGGLKRSVRVVVDREKLQQRGVAMTDVAQALKANDAYSPAGKNWGEQQVYDVEVGGRLTSATEVGQVAIGQRAGAVVRVRDVAQILDGPEARTRESWLLDKANPNGLNAVSISFAKRQGTNVVTLAQDLVKRAELFASALPTDVSMSQVRNYGLTAADKSNELIEHLLIATLSVAILIALFMGLRASLVVVVAIPVTLALTLAIYYFMGYTLNRVTLFALIFSIGILVDDAIVVVENIERHLKKNQDLSLVEATLRAVSEVGNPTILATFTVIAAILPMAFVRGLMGPYMAPIPVGASLAMILSLFVAFIVTPWASVRLLKVHSHEPSGNDHQMSRLDRIYARAMNGLLGGKLNAFAFGTFVVVLLMSASSLVYFKAVKVKMLPFDNKGEFQVLLDYPPTTTLEQSVLWSRELGAEILKHDDIEKVQVFAGEAAPYSFSGMVKHTFLRRADYLNDLQIVIRDKAKRKKSSHEIITELRHVVKEFAHRREVVAKVLEIPPGPPVLATMVAEIYGPTPEERGRVAAQVHSVFAQEPSVVDLDYSWRPGRPRQVYAFDFEKGGWFGLQAQALMQSGRMVFSETPVSLLNTVEGAEDVAIELSLESSVRSSARPFSGQTAPSFEAGVVDLERVMQPPVTKASETLFRKNLKPVSYVMSELAGEEEAPVYGMIKLQPQIPFPMQTAEVPWNTSEAVVKWDGEWFITYEVFRDLGGAFAVVMVLIYVLVLGWFRSFAVPLVIMVPIPLSLIGILPGHWLTGAYFTATSMIGFIAGAGIIVRNSIILVDFIEHQIKQGLELKEAVLTAGILRFRPMLLTAAAVVVGSAVMLADPIFQGLAVSLIFGEVAATILSRFAVPVLYYYFVGKVRVRVLHQEALAEETFTAPLSNASSELGKTSQAPTHESTNIHSSKNKKEVSHVY